ncbi:MAG TPA: hypothetical protein VK816_11290 [Jatrophihabitantaceae bacterium]|nr:hypothetical protein [Jatrophihabitantaceae bacterium]
MAYVTSRAQYIDGRSSKWDDALRQVGDVFRALYTRNFVSGADAASLLDGFQVLVKKYDENAVLINDIKKYFGLVRDAYPGMLNGALAVGQANNFASNMNTLYDRLLDYVVEPSGHSADLAAAADIANWFNNELVPAAARQHYVLAPMPPS